MSGSGRQLHTNVNPQSEVASPKLLSLYFLLSGILGGLLIVISVFIFCKYCRGRSHDNSDYEANDNWSLEVESRYRCLELENGTYALDIQTRVGDGLAVSQSSRLTSDLRGSLKVCYTTESPHDDSNSGSLEDGPRIRVTLPAWASEEAGKPAVFLQRQVSSRNSDHRMDTWAVSTSSSREKLGCIVSVEVHPGPGVPPLDIATIRRPSGASSRTSSGRTRSGSASPPTLSTLSTAFGAHHHQDKAPGSDIPLRAHTSPWELDSDSSLAAYRAPSTDWTVLESNLDFWRREHSRIQPCNRDEEDEWSSKVRYNDTGSLEEVNVGQMIDYYAEDDEDMVVISESERDDLRMEYRRLWELRATLEEDEDLIKPERNKKQKPHQETSKKTQSLHKQRSLKRDFEHQGRLGQELELMEIPTQSKSSTDQSPDVATSSHTTSFESNTEPCPTDEATSASWHLLPLPTYESRRQSYKNILSWRLRRMEAKGARQPSQEETSFDSIDTEGSSTDASRIEQVTTSFDSTTDNTDSTGGTENQSHRLHQLRGDSGYRSIENPGLPGKLAHHQHPLSANCEEPQHLISPDDSDQEAIIPRQRPMNLGDSSELDTPKRPHRRPSLGDSGDLNVPKRSDIWPCTLESMEDEGVSGLHSPTGAEPSLWEVRRRSCGRSASKKRREFGKSVTDLDNPVLHRRCHSLRTYCSTSYARDYSVDEKSDALFREFSRCEPWSMEVPSQRLASGSGTANYQRLQHPSRHSIHHHSHPYPDHIHKTSVNRSSIHEELTSSSHYVDDETQQAAMPIIKVADDDTSSDHL